MHSFQFITHILQSELPFQYISKSFGERTLFKDISFELIKIKNCLHCQKNGSGKTIMSIINGLEESDTGQVVLRKA
jgi:ATP-binding cassette subfamily F protein uup